MGLALLLLSAPSVTLEAGMTATSTRSENVTVLFVVGGDSIRMANLQCRLSLSNYAAACVQSRGSSSVMMGVMFSVFSSRHLYCSRTRYIHPTMAWSNDWHGCS